VKGGKSINTYRDHRIAMSFICLGQIAQNPIEINEADSIATSFPNFIEKFKEIGGNLSEKLTQ
jgi:3-phosphoshikimate 1-carboxyvinyltransferase